MTNDEIDDILMRREPSAAGGIEGGVLDGRPDTPGDPIDDILMRRGPANTSPPPVLDNTPTELAPPEQAPPEERALGTPTQVSQGMMGSFIDLLGLPGDAANWAMEKAGLQPAFHGGESLRKMGAKAGIAFEQGKEPDTAAIKSGQYMAMGLEFLAPFLALNKAATMAKVAPGAAAPAVMPQTISAKGKDIAATMAAPFATAPKVSLYSEAAGGAVGGLGAYYGGKEYGPVGEMIGGFAGVIPQIGPSLGMSAMQAIRKEALPITPAGIKSRAAGSVQKLIETSPNDIVGTIANESKRVLKGAKISPARLSGDKHLIAMEEKILSENPRLAYEFELNRNAVNDLARKEMQELGGNIPIEKTQAYFNWRVDHVNKVLDKQLESSVDNAKRSLELMSPQTSRESANRLAEKAVGQSLTAARQVETDAWKQVDKSVITTTETGRTRFKELIDERASSADKNEIPAFVGEFLGKYNKNGQWVAGKFDGEESVHELQTFRSRLTAEMRAEAGSDNPNWGRHRILDEVQTAVLDDLGKVEGQSGLKAAIEVSRNLNKTFKSDTLNTILGSKVTGTKLAPELTLEGIKEGPKAGVMARELLEASPEARPMIEEFLKSKIANSLVDKNTGRLKATAAKKYVDNNELLFDQFPELRSSLEHAIGQEERTAGTLLKGKAARKAILGSSMAKIGGMKPGRVMNEILTSQNPQNEMKTAFNRSNKAGRAGLKGDVMNYLLGKSKTGKFNDNNQPVLSGRKMAFEWQSNKKVFGEALTPAESKRIDTVVNTLIKNEDVDTPTIGDIVKPTKGLLLFLTRVAAAQTGARVSRVTGPGAIQIPGEFSKKAAQRFQALDTGAAKQLIVDAIQDEKLFKALITEMSNPTIRKRVLKVLQGWMLAHAMKSADDDSE